MYICVVQTVHHVRSLIISKFGSKELDNIIGKLVKAKSNNLKPVCI